MSADLGTDWRRLAEKQAESLKEAAETVESLRQRLQRVLEEVREEFADDIGNHAAPEWVERLVAGAGVPDRGDDVSDKWRFDVWRRRAERLQEFVERLAKPSLTGCQCPCHEEAVAVLEAIGARENGTYKSDPDG